MDIEEAVGAELQACRPKKQISQEQLGFDAAIHRTYVSMIERGVKSPTLDPSSMSPALCASAAYHRVSMWQKELGQPSRLRTTLPCSTLNATVEYGGRVDDSRNRGNGKGQCENAAQLDT